MFACVLYEHESAHQMQREYVRLSAETEALYQSLKDGWPPNSLLKFVFGHLQGCIESHQSHQKR